MSLQHSQWNQSGFIHSATALEWRITLPCHLHTLMPPREILPGLMTVLSLTWQSPYLGKTVFILRLGRGISIVGMQDRSSIGAHSKASQAKFVSCGMEHHPLVTCAAIPAHITFPTQHYLRLIWVEMNNAGDTYPLESLIKHLVLSQKTIWYVG